MTALTRSNGLRALPASHLTAPRLLDQSPCMEQISEQHNARRVAIVTVTHMWNPRIADEHAKRRREAASFGDVHLAFHHYNHPPPQEENMEVITRAETAQPGYPVPPIPIQRGGHVLLLFMEFVRRRPNYDYYWLIEFDVRFSGSWDHFLEAFYSVDTDLLAPQIRHHHQQPQWPWWSTLSTPSERVPDEHRLRCLAVICRFSKRALEHIHEASLCGWNGHAEVLLPTLLNERGFSISDIGGHGPFTPDALRGRFYRDGPDRARGLNRHSSIRTIPPRLSCGRARDCLYHPVKPFRQWCRGRLKWAVTVLLRSRILSPLLRLIRRLCR